MPTEWTFSPGRLYGFLLVLARVGGALSFVPLPGIRAVPEPVRAVLAVAITLALAARWPVMDSAALNIGTVVVWVAAEAAVGISIGLTVAIVLEAFTLAAQVLGLQAGYAYASTVDPNTEADSGVLLVVMQMIAGMLFFALGLDREILRIFALSLDRVPPGTYVYGASSADGMIRLGAGMFSSGVRLALPVVALLILVDVALALLGRLNQQLQLLSLAFPAKMLTALLVLSWVAPSIPRLMLELRTEAWAVAQRLLGM